MNKKNQVLPIGYFCCMSYDFLFYKLYNHLIIPVFASISFLRIKLLNATLAFHCRYATEHKQCMLNSQSNPIALKRSH